MARKGMHRVCCAGLMIGLAVTTMASTVDVGLEVFLVTVDPVSNEETLEPTEVARPGDVLAYLLWAYNDGQEPAEGLMLVGPIPDHTRLLDDWYEAIVAFLDTGDDAPVFYVRKVEGEEPEVRYMGEDALPEFSMDDGETFSPPPVKVEIDGEMERATADMFSHVRWTLGPLAPGQRVEMRYRIWVP